MNTVAPSAHANPEPERPQLSREDAVAVAYSLGERAGRNLASLKRGVTLLNSLSDEELWDLGTALQEISRGRAEHTEQQAQQPRARLQLLPGGAA